MNIHMRPTVTQILDDKPISIILTTLSAHAYQGEETIAQALFAILSKMDDFIEQTPDGRHLIVNPSDPLENFADKWSEHPERATAFYWLDQARADFAAIAALSNKQLITDYLAKRVGRDIADRVLKRSAARLGAPAVLTDGLVRSEAEARRAPPRLEGDRRNA